MNWVQIRDKRINLERVTHYDAAVEQLSGKPYKAEIMIDFGGSRWLILSFSDEKEFEASLELLDRESVPTRIQLEDVRF